MKRSQLKFLYGLQKFGIKLGLKNIHSLLEELSHPERAYPIIHIAGTNGKGSTASMIASILTASGYRTGLYTSPHLVRFHERIRVDGREVSDEILERSTEILRKAIMKTRSTFFEATTAIALKYFKDAEVDVAVLETGLGGRYDATNAVSPVLSLITTIGFDHTEQLGSTLRKIAFEKGGIIKPRVPCLTAVEDPGALAVLKAIAREKNSRLILAGDRSALSITGETIEGFRAHLLTPAGQYRDLSLPLAGEYQGMNLRLAVMAAEELRDRCGFTRIGRESIERGLRDIRLNTGLRGRMEVLSRRPCIILDVAHNPEGIRAALSSLRRLLPRPAVVVFGVMKDKDISAMTAHFRDTAGLIIAVAPKGERALASASVLQAFREQGIPAVDGKTVRRGLALGLREASLGEPLLIIGSHYVAGEALSFLDEKVRGERGKT